MKSTTTRNASLVVTARCESMVKVAFSATSPAYGDRMSSASLDTHETEAAIVPGRSDRAYVGPRPSLRRETKDAIPVGARRTRAELRDARAVHSVQFHFRRGGREFLEQRFGLVPALLAEVRQRLVETVDLQKRVAADFALGADGLENRDTLALALNPDLVHFPIDEVLHGVHDVLGDEDAYAVFLGEILETGGEVYGVSHYRVGTAKL